MIPNENTHQTGEQTEQKLFNMVTFKMFVTFQWASLKNPLGINVKFLAVAYGGLYSLNGIHVQNYCIT